MQKHGFLQLTPKVPVLLSSFITEKTFSKATNSSKINNKQVARAEP